MNRIERTQLIDRLQAEIAQTLLDMARRREQLGDEAFQPDILRRDWPARRSAQHQTRDLHFRVNENAMINPPQPQPQFVTEAQLRAGIHQLAEITADETARFTRVECDKVIVRQDSEVAALRAEMAALRERVDALENTVADQAAQLDALQADVGDAFDRGTKVSWLKQRKSDAA